jgi:hypothetical protein
MARASALLLLVTACAGSPVEADSLGDGGSGTGGTTGAGLGGASLSSSSPGDGSVDGGPGPSDEPTGDASSGPTGASTDPTAAPTDSSEGTVDPSAGTSSTTDTGGDASSSSSTTGAAGGCLGDPLPEVVPAECSDADAEEVDLTIDNGCDFDVEVFWVAYDCGEVSYQVISGGNSWGIQTFATHPWRIRSARDGELLLEIAPLQGDTQVMIQ